MKSNYQLYELVRIIAQPSAIRDDLLFKEGYITSFIDSNNDYAVHINEFGETFVIPECNLEATGRFGNTRDIVSRGSRIGCRRSPWPPPGHSLIAPSESSVFKDDSD